MDKERQKKVKFQSLEAMRNRVGAKKNPINITPSQWDAIQAGAISPTMLRDILSNSNMDVVQDLASPRKKALTASKEGQAKALLAKGYTMAEVSQRLGVSISTINRELGITKSKADIARERQPT